MQLARNLPSGFLGGTSALGVSRGDIRPRKVLLVETDDHAECGAPRDGWVMGTEGPPTGPGGIRGSGQLGTVLAPTPYCRGPVIRHQAQEETPPPYTHTLRHMSHSSPLR